jgi:lipopolysaccharide biosynthesis regulator YciM
MWDDFTAVVRENPLLLEGIAAVVLFVIALLAFRRIQRIAAELERRKALSDYVRGLDEFLRGDHRDAIATLEKVLERDPESVEARIALGDCYRALGDAAEAKKHHHHVHKVFGHELARNFVSLGKDELALRNHDLAVEAFTRATELNPRDPEALAGLARAYAETNNPVAAAECLRELYPDGPDADLGKTARREAAGRFARAGATALEEGNPQGAVRFYTEALAFWPGSLKARTGLLRAAHELGDDEQARALVDEHLAALRELAGREETLFEPAVSQARPTEPAAAPEPTGSMLPARLEDVGGMVARVEEKTARYGCSACGALLREHAPACPVCESVGTVEAVPELARLFTMPVPSFEAAIDEVEESPAWVHRLARNAATGDEEALTTLLERGPSVLYEVFAALPAVEGRRYLGSRMATLGAAAALEVRQCHAAQTRPGLGTEATAHDEFAVGYYLALGAEDAASFLVSLGESRDAALAGALADVRLAEELRDSAQALLAERMDQALVPVIEAVAATGGEPGAVARAASLLRGWGPDAVERIDKRYFHSGLLGRIFRGARGARRRAAADVLGSSGLPAAVHVLGRIAAQEKDPGLRSHYVRAKERASEPREEGP